MCCGCGHTEGTTAMTVQPSEKIVLIVMWLCGHLCGCPSGCQLFVCSLYWCPCCCLAIDRVCLCCCLSCVIRLLFTPFSCWLLVPCCVVRIGLVVCVAVVVCAIVHILFCCPCLLCCCTCYCCCLILPLLFKLSVLLPSLFPCSV